MSPLSEGLHIQQASTGCLCLRNILWIQAKWFKWYHARTQKKTKNLSDLDHWHSTGF